MEVLGVSDSLKQTVTSEQSAQQAYRDIISMAEGHGYCVVTIRAGGRSLEQNALYWTWMQEIADAVNKRNQSDYSREEVHDKFKRMFLGLIPANKIVSTEIQEKHKSTSKMTNS